MYTARYFGQEDRERNVSNPNNPSYPNILFKTDHGGCADATEDWPWDRVTEQLKPARIACFEDITTPLINSMINAGVTLDFRHDVDVPPAIKGIAIDPLDHDRVFICFSGYTEDAKVWYTEDGGITWDNADMGISLPNLPVNGIVYQKGSDDRLFISTDVGVYTHVGSLTAPDNNWERYGNSPRVLTGDLKINYCAATLRVATYGRGLWEADLPEVDDLISERVISTSQTWPVFGEEVSLSTNLRIPTGVTLTVKGFLSMPVKGRIIVEPGATLILDGGRITNFCGNQWKGIELLGNPAFPQTPGANGLLAQGKAEIINGAWIEHARNAIYTWDGVDHSTTAGGLIIAKNATFKNNRRSIEFMAYQSINGDPNLSEFENCTFVVDDAYQGSDPFLAHMTLWGIDGLEIEGCKFENTMTDWALFTNYNDRGTGIYAIDADFEVFPLSPTQKCVFNGLGSGIYAGQIGSLSTFSVNESDFILNIVGINVQGIKNFEVTQNYVEIGGNPALPPVPTDPNVHKGVYVTQSFGFDIEENTFLKTELLDYSTKVGIEADNLGPTANKIHYNTFSQLDFGNLAKGENKQTNGIGLVYTCNQNSQNDYDFFVEFSPNSSHGIAKTQQVNGTTGARNTFSFTGGTGTGDFINQMGTFVDYYYQSQYSMTEEPIVTFNMSLINVGGISTYSCGGTGTSRLAGINREGIPALISAYQHQLDSLIHISNQQLSTESRAYIAAQNEISDVVYQLIKLEYQKGALVNYGQIRKWLTLLNNLSGAYAVAETYLEEGNWTEGMKFLAMIPQHHEMSPTQKEDYKAYVKVKQLLFSLHQEGKAIYQLSPTQHQELENQAEADSNLAAIQARNILGLIAYTSMEVNDSQEMIDDEGITISDQPRLKLYPNPAMNKVNIRYHLPKGVETGLVQIIDIQGNVLYQETVESEEKPLLVQTDNLAAGMYFCRLIVDGKSSRSKKLAIIK